MDKTKKDAPSKPKEPRKKKEPKKVESSSDDDDDGKPITWYKHRETKLPDSNVVHTKLETSPAKLEKSTSEGSAWNTAGTWEEKNVGAGVYLDDASSARVEGRPRDVVSFSEQPNRSRRARDRGAPEVGTPSGAAGRQGGHRGRAHT